MTRRNPFRDIYDSPEYLEADRLATRAYPLLIDLELTNGCNLNCLQCWRHDMRRPITSLEPSVVRRLLAEASGRVHGVRFIGHGESLIHPDFLDLVADAKEQGLLVHLTTNGLLLNEARTHRLLDAGLDSIVFSFQGTDKAGYEAMRRNSRYDDLCAVIRKLVLLRGDRPEPYVVVNTTVLDESDEQISDFRNRWLDIVDEVGHWFTTLERLDHLEHVRKLLPRQRIRKAMTGRVRCIEVHTKLSINSDGQASLCCNDYNGELAVGSVYTQSLAELWGSKRARALRTIIGDDHGKVVFCRKCSNKFNRVDDSHV